MLENILHWSLLLESWNSYEHAYNDLKTPLSDRKEIKPYGNAGENWLYNFDISFEDELNEKQCNLVAYKRVLVPFPFASSIHFKRKLKPKGVEYEEKFRFLTAWGKEVCDTKLMTIELTKESRTE